MSDSTKTSTKAGAIHLTDGDLQKTLEETKLPIFIDFYATWCGPCKVAGPVVDKLAGELDGKVLITKLDVDENPDSAKKFGVMSIPTVVVMKREGDQMVEVDRKVGFPGEQGYRQMLAKVMPAAGAQAA